MPQRTLDQLKDAHDRIRAAIYRRASEAADFNDEEIFEAIYLDGEIADAAFFVLIFGHLENRINKLAAEKLQTDAQVIALREVPFERRLKMALPDAAKIRKEIENWYKLRNSAAHGDGIEPSYDIATVTERAHAIETLINSNKSNVQSPSTTEA